MIITKKLRRTIKEICKHGPARVRVADINYTINERAWYAEQIRKHARLGVIGIRTSGMDCDCTAYQRAGNYRLPKTLVEFVMAEQVRQEGLDGPETRTFCAPIPKAEQYSKSRDLALEAYEDGHPHYVIWPATL